MIEFFGTNVKAVGGSDVLKMVANLVAVAKRTRTQILTPEMKAFIFDSGDDDIVVDYLAFCQLLGQRTSMPTNNVLLRQVSRRSVSKQIRDLRRSGLDVVMTGGTVRLYITPAFKENAAAIPVFFREQKREISMTKIIAEGQRVEELNRKPARRAA